MCNSKSPYVRAKRKENVQENLGTVLGYAIGYPWAAFCWLIYYIGVPIALLALPVYAIVALFG